MIFFINIVLFFIVLRFCITLFNFISQPKLGNYGVHYSDKVSILIPARNEGHRILELLHSIAQQDYTNYEVIVLDDHSDDDTFEKCLHFSSIHPQFKVVKGRKLPENWLGKNYACHQLANLATGNYLLFLDADDIIHTGLIHNSLFRIKTYKLALLSLFTVQKMHTFGEKSTIPLMHYLLLNLLPLVLVRLSKWSTFSAASGQMMLFDAEIYTQQQWHQQVATCVVEDIEIVKRVKNNGFIAETLLANGMIECRMYQNYHEAVDGFSKNILSGFNNQIFALLTYLILIWVGPIYLIYILPLNMSILPIGLILMSRLMISYLSEQNPLTNLYLHPIQMLNLMFISLISIYKQITHQNYWKGRKI